MYTAKVLAAFLSRTHLQTSSHLVSSIVLKGHQQRIHVSLSCAVVAQWIIFARGQEGPQICRSRQLQRSPIRMSPRNHSVLQSCRMCRWSTYTTGPSNFWRLVLSHVDIKLLICISGNGALSIKYRRRNIDVNALTTLISSQTTRRNQAAQT